MAFDREKLERWTDEDAYQFVIERLVKIINGKSRVDRHTGFDVTATWLVNEYLQDERITERNDQLSAHVPIAEKMLSALWQLCLREVLRPSVRHLHVSYATEQYTGDGYSITEKGLAFLKNGTDTHTLIASSSFLKLLLPFVSRFGPSYEERITDAVRCFDAAANVACCAMSGAACESIFLSLAIVKDGNAEAILKRYQAAQGRKDIKNLIEHGLSSPLASQLDSGFTVLTYWRDHGAHGARTGLGRAEARFSLNTLLNLAQLANDRWDDITAKSPQQHLSAPAIKT